MQAIVQKKNTQPSFRLLLHISLWTAYFISGYYFNKISFNLFAGTSFSWKEPLANTINLIAFYYPFMYLTWPLLAKKRKYALGICLLILQILLFTILLKVAERTLLLYCAECREIMGQLRQDLFGPQSQTFINGILSSFLSLGTLYVLIFKLSPVIAIKLALDYARERTTSIGLEKENLLLEFNFLQSQVNPHFLFNTLNNIHSLIVQDQKKQASATVDRLSGFLRHSLYESGQNSISLAQEIKLLEDYLELEKIRLNKTQVTMQAGTDESSFPLPPLLFIPLVENAFKYNADNLSTDSFIDINLQQKKGTLQFCCRNNYDPAKRNPFGGIGLQNLRKRLQHYFPGSHEVQVFDSNHVYEIKINLTHA